MEGREMKSSPRHEFRAPNTLGGDLPDREGLTAGSFIPEIALGRKGLGLGTSTAGDGCEPANNPEIARTFREKASLSSTVGGEREPTNFMYRRRNLDMCSIRSSLFFLRETSYPTGSNLVGGSA